MVKGFIGNDFFLSNAYPHALDVPFGNDTLTVPSAVHAFYVSGTDDPKVVELILSSLTARSARQRGAPHMKFSEAEQLDLMRNILRIKYTDPLLRKKLASRTPPFYYISADPFWGCQLKEDGTVCGFNYLGMLTHQVWDEVRKDENLMVISAVTFLVIPDNNGKFLAFVDEPDYTKPHGQGSTMLEAVSNLCVVLGVAYGEAWASDHLIIE